MAAVLVRAEVAVIQVLGEMNVTERVAAAHGKLIVMPGEPAQRFSPLALASIGVRVVSERKAARNRKVMAAVIKMAVPAFRQQVKQRGVESGRNGITGEAAGESKPLQREQFEIAAIKKTAAGIGKAHRAHAGAYSDILAQSESRFAGSGEKRFSEGAGLPERSFIQPHTGCEIPAELINHALARINRAVA